MFTVITCQRNLQICLELVPGLLGQVQVQFRVIQNTFKSEPMSEIFCQKQAAAKLNVMTASLIQVWVICQSCLKDQAGWESVFQPDES